MSNELVDIRNRAGKTQQECADAIGVVRSTYCQYEKGDRDIPAEALQSLCDFLGGEVADIFLPRRFTMRERPGKAG